MSALSLMYHDIIGGHPGDSGFRGPGPAMYKVELNRFIEHLECIKQCTGKRVVTVSAETLTGGNAVYMTFDDGGCGATDAAGALEQYGFRGHFFMATNYIGQENFLTEDEIRSLHRRGHIIGSHSCSHPARMSALSDEVIEKEWRVSLETLSRILGVPVHTASVPAGYYSGRVAAAAERAGIRFLFTSEPVSRVSVFKLCTIIGRYTITRSTKLSEIEGLVEGRFTPVIRQYVAWNSKKIIKKVCGNNYIRLRRKLIRH